ncbi:MAG: hypothetical protein ACRC52_17690, partial [Aeromonas veronii]
MTHVFLGSRHKIAGILRESRPVWQPKAGRLGASFSRRDELMRRAVITGIGVISSIGNNKEEVLASLKA